MRNKLARCIHAEIRFSDQALARELEIWKRKTEKSDGDYEVFEVHHSQIERICRTLECARQTLGLGEMTALNESDEDELLSGLQARRHNAQSLYLVWNFFRDKLLQRTRREYQEYLRAADDLAWECYRPFLEKLADPKEKIALREPPLVFFSLEPAPFAQARSSAFAPRGLSTRQLERLYTILRMLPVPIIGLPWLQSGLFPDLCLVGHEVAHIVADDLELERDFPAMVAGIDAIEREREPVWQKWFDETFADIMGVIACGAGFGAALIRALAGDRATIRAQQPDPRGAYPPRQVRVLIAEKTAQVLSEQGMEVTTEFADEWRASYGAIRDDAFARDVEPLVRTLLGHEFERLGMATLAQVLQPPRQARIKAYQSAARSRQELKAFDLRAAIAAAALAHPDDADGSFEVSEEGKHTWPPYRFLAGTIRTNRKVGYRDASELYPTGIAQGSGPVESERLRVRDDTIGQAIADLFRD